MWKFDAVAYFKRSIAGRQRLSTRDEGMEGLFAGSAEAAARIWLHRLGDAERAATERVIVWSPKPKPAIQVYEGPTIVFKRDGNRLVEVERRPPA